jgi:hypothetical protein
VRKEQVRFYVQSNAYTEMPNPPVVKEEPPFLKHVNVWERKKNWALHLVFSPQSNPIYYVGVQHRQYSVSA